MRGSSSLTESPRNLLSILLGSGSLFIFLYLAWLLWGGSDLFERRLVGSLAMVFTSLAAFTIVLWMRSQLKEGRLRLPWKWLSYGLGLWATADIVRLAVAMIFPGSPVKFSAADGLALSGFLPVWIGLLRYPRQARPRFGRLLTLFDTTIVMASGITLAWMTVFQPLLARPADLAGWNQAGLFYPLAGLVSLFLVVTLFLLSDASQLTTPFYFFALGITALTISDLALASPLAQGGFLPGLPSNTGWAAANLLLALSAVSELSSRGKTMGEPHPTRLVIRGFQRLLPLVATLALGWYTLFLWQFQGQLNQPGLWVTLILSLALITRQGVLAGEMELQKYASLVNSVADPAFVCDRHGRLRLVNPALLSATGHANPQELFDQPLQHILHPAAGIGRIVDLGLAQGWSGEVHLRRRNGGLIPISLALRPLQGQSDKRLALAGTAHDLSEQKRQQAALQAAYEQIAEDRAELESLNYRLEGMVAEKTADLLHAMQKLEQQNLSLQQLDQLKSDFVSLVSHELRAPLTNISGGIELLLSPSNSLDARNQRNLELVQSEIKRLSRFVESILDLSALDAGRMPLYPAPVSLHSIIRNLQKANSNLPGMERLRWDAPENLPPLLADEQALSSLLFHLLDNAFKYAPQGEITITAEIDDNLMKVMVMDTGPGIPQDALPLIFDRFYRQDSGDARTVYGHGLGLYIVSRLLSAMEGEITAENRPAGGACFTFRLPLVDQNGSEDEP